MKKYMLFLLSMMMLAACSSNDVKNIHNVELNYWNESTPSETIDNKDIVQIFVNVVNNAEKLDKGKIIETKPILSFSLEGKESENKNYHLWVTENGEGYIQQLLPDENGTLKINDKSVRELTNFIEEKEDVQLISSLIKFERKEE